MKKTFRCIINIGLYLITFILMQLLGSVVFGKMIEDKVLAITLAFGISSVLTIAIFHFARWAPLGMQYISTHPYPLLIWMAILTIGLLAPSQFLEGLISSDMPNQLIEMLGTIISHPLGFLVISILAPIAEEMVFRGAILRSLLKYMRNPWLAIVISAAIFGLIHANLPQFMHAFLIGLLLGWAFYRTGSILPGLIMHWVNNSAAFILCRIYPDKMDATLLELFNGNSLLMYSVLAVSVLLSILSFWQVWRTIGNRAEGKGLETQ
jgi:membrane protease YdiL (CAAX protease family)